MTLTLITKNGRRIIDRHLPQYEVNRIITMYSELFNDSRSDVERIKLIVSDD